MDYNELLDELSATSSNAEKIEYDDKYILKRLMEGKSRDEIALELNHKNYRTMDMYMRRRGYIWSTEKQIYLHKINPTSSIDYDYSNYGKIQKIISLFNSGLEPSEIAKKVGMKDHRSMAEYMKAKGYLWSPENQNYILLKGAIPFEEDKEDIEIENEKENLVSSITIDENINIQQNDLNQFQGLLPMLEMINKNKDKLIELLSINSSSTIPRYIVGGITITKSLCMAHPLSELVKEFSKEKNISQREIFEIALIEFLKKYGYEDEIAALFS